MKFKHHKYIFTKRLRSRQHCWQLVGPDGGIHFRFGEYFEESSTAGLEFHHTRTSKPDYANNAPDVIKCFLTGEPCWHDGTSLYATDTLLPLVKQWMLRQDHESIFTQLELEYEQHFDSEGEKS